MERTTELFPAAPHGTPSESAESAVAVSASAEQPARKYPRFAAVHTLLMKVDTLADVGSGFIWVRDTNGIMHETSTSKITRDNRMVELLQWIAEGRVSVLWDHRYHEFEEITPEWPRFRRPDPENGPISNP